MNVTLQAAVHSVTQKVIFVDSDDGDAEVQKKAILLEFLESLESGEKVLVFVGKKSRVDDLSSDFVLKGINCQVGWELFCHLALDTRV